jgi:hypothetical protein
MFHQGNACLGKMQLWNLLPLSQLQLFQWARRWLLQPLSSQLSKLSCRKQQKRQQPNECEKHCNDLSSSCVFLPPHKLKV